MSIRTLLILLPGSLFKSQCQLALENLALRQQETVLRQSVKRPRATAADKLFCSKRYVQQKKRKHQTTRRTRRTRRQAIYPKPLQGIIGIESSGLTGVSTPPYTPYFFHSTQYIAPRVPRGFLIGARARQLPLTTPATSYWHQSGNLWGALPRGITLAIA